MLHKLGIGHVVLHGRAKDYDLTPTRVLAEEMERAGHPHRRLILPAYGTTSQFPRSTYRSANYWVDVVFSDTLAT